MVYTHIYTMEYYLMIKKNGIIPSAATWMDLEIIILNEVSQTNTIWHHLYVESKKKKNDTNELYSQNRNRLMVTKGGKEGKEEFVINGYTLLFSH